jgi:enolase-phosphatase E1
MNEVRGILLDIEGTVTPISFVHDVLFPFAKLHVREFLEQHAVSGDVQEDLARLRQEHARDSKANNKPPPLINEPDEGVMQSLIGYVNWLIDLDRKSPGLKSLQGKIWKQGYVDGSLKAPLFDDVMPALQRWQQKGILVSIFSSGSVLAQKLLFSHTVAGDLTRYIAHYFDTAVGKKDEVESYTAIASRLSLSAQQVLFISDVVSELDAASTAGMKTRLCIRPGNPPQPSPSAHEEIRTLSVVSS